MMETQNVMIVRLTTGEEILCDFEKTKNGVKVKKPLLIVPVSVTNISFVPWLGYADISEGVDIPEKILAFTVKPTEGLSAKFKTVWDEITAARAGIVSGEGMAQLGNKLRLTDE